MAARTFALATMLVGLGIAGYGAYLMLVGPESIVVEAVFPGEPMPEPVRTFEPTDRGVVPLLAGAAVFVGVLARRVWAAWLGAVTIAAFAVVYTFSVGAVLIPVAALLLVFLAIHTATRGTRVEPAT